MLEMQLLSVRLLNIEINHVSSYFQWTSNELKHFHNLN